MKWKLTIVIDGESADDLMAAGPNDLVDYFLPEGLRVKKKDIKVVAFNEDASIEEFGDALIGKRPLHRHKDNYYRDKELDVESVD